MSDNLVLELLRAIRGDIGQVSERQQEHGRRLSRIELTLAGLRREQANDAEARADLEVSVDRLRERLDRVERRLELTPGS